MGVYFFTKYKGELELVMLVHLVSTFMFFIAYFTITYLTNRFRKNRRTKREILINSLVISGLYFLAIALIKIISSK
ncbi:hypothetical protein [Caloranaerobacter sp. DY30410]|uniref:hypothetical protein n=1 Tax=Caloranaerobacter sp. DY30410 TaxID=3238305 RepID=UPI003CFFBA52